MPESNGLTTRMFTWASENPKWAVLALAVILSMPTILASVVVVVGGQDAVVGIADNVGKATDAMDELKDEVAGLRTDLRQTQRDVNELRAAWQRTTNPPPPDPNPEE